VSESFDFVEPRRFLTGTVGPPGQRTFYLQADDDTHQVTLKVEKQQIAALCDYLAGILADLPPSPSLDSLDDADQLSDPIDESWVVGNLAVAYEQERDRILVVAEELVADEEWPPEDESDLFERAFGDAPSRGATARFLLRRDQVAVFVRHGLSAVQAGRPPCRLCGRPLDPDGHNCPRLN